MKVTPTELPEVLLIEPRVFEDQRGFFLETWHAERYAEAGIPGPFVQDNHSRSVRGILRGLHLQVEHAQGKLLRVPSGEIFDVAVDVRVGSPRFGRWMSVILSGENHRQIWIPPGFAHGFCVLSEVADVEYKCTDIYYPPGEVTIAWNDDRIGVEWPVGEPLLSDKDRRGERLEDVMERLPAYEG